jgi:hypothetical protein
MLHRVTGSVAENLASGIDPLFFPCCVDIFEERLAEPDVDLDDLGPVVAACGIRVGRIQMLCVCIYEILSSSSRSSSSYACGPANSTQGDSEWSQQPIDYLVCPRVGERDWAGSRLR